MTRRATGKGTESRAAADPIDNVTPMTTIVGGQPPRKAKATARVPIGIEKVLYLAASNPKFRSSLLEDRAGAVARSGVRLTDIERSTLLGVPRPALEAMIGRISPERHGKRSFMKTVAAATVSLAAGVVAPGCNEESGPEPGLDVPDTTEATDADAGDSADVEPPDGTRGITADVPDDADVDVPPEFAPGGVMPDADVDPGFEGGAE